MVDINGNVALNALFQITVYIYIKRKNERSFKNEMSV